MKIELLKVIENAKKNYAYVDCYCRQNSESIILSGSKEDLCNEWSQLTFENQIFWILSICCVQIISILLTELSRGRIIIFEIEFSGDIYFNF